MEMSMSNTIEVKMYKKEKEEEDFLQYCIPINYKKRFDIDTAVINLQSQLNLLIIP